MFLHEKFEAKFAGCHIERSEGKSGEASHAGQGGGGSGKSGGGTASGSNSGGLGGSAGRPGGVGNTGNTNAANARNNFKSGTYTRDSDPRHDPGRDIAVQDKGKLYTTPDWNEAVRAYHARMRDYTDEDNSFLDDIGNFLAKNLFDTQEMEPEFSMDNVSPNATWGTDFGAMAAGFLGSAIGGPVVGILSDKIAHWGLDKLGHPFTKEWNNPGNVSDPNLGDRFQDVDNETSSAAAAASSGGGWLGGGIGASKAADGSTKSVAKGDTITGTRQDALSGSKTNPQRDPGTGSPRRDDTTTTTPPPATQQPAQDLLSSLLSEFTMYAMPGPKQLDKSIHDDLMQQLYDYRSAS